MIEVSGGLFLSDPLKIGKKLKDFSLKGIDGQTYNLKSFVTKRILVIVFTSNNSRCAAAYDSRLRAIQETYMDRGVQVVAVNSNNDYFSKHDSFHNMIEHARKRGFNFPYLRDKYQTLAKDFDVVCTPEAFIFDEERVLQYRGKIDDNWSNPKAVETNFVVRAIKELLAHKSVSIKETVPFGDSIKWNY